MQTGLAKGPIDEGVFSLYDQFDGSGGKVPLSVQRREHLEMWMLLGDPALHLPVVPADIHLKAATPVTGRKQIKAQGTLPDRLKRATVDVSIEPPVGSKPGDWEKLPDASPENAAAQEKMATETHRRAKNAVVAEADVKSDQARFSCSLELPAKLLWPNLVVRLRRQREPGRNGRKSIAGDPMKRFGFPGRTSRRLIHDPGEVRP